MYDVQDRDSVIAALLEVTFREVQHKARQENRPWGVRVSPLETIKKRELNYYRTNHDGKIYYRDAIVFIVVNQDGSYIIEKGASLIPWFNQPRKAGGTLWWEEQDAKKAELRRKVADLHKEIRDFLGDPS